MDEPQTDQEWQEAVDLAHVYLQVESARQYGLISGGPEVDVDRCENIIARGLLEHGITPAKDALERILPRLMGGQLP